MKRINFQTIFNKLTEAFRRFPAAALAATALCVLMTVQIINTNLQIGWQWFYMLAIAPFWCISVTLFAEHQYSQARTNILSFGVLIIWCAYCIFALRDESRYNTSVLILQFALSTAAVLSIFAVSFLKNTEESNRQFWNFTVNVLIQLCTALAFGLILTVGLCGAFAGINALFDINISDKVFETTWAVFGYYFTAIYFLGNIPDKVKKFDSELYSPKLLKLLALYILTPLVALYFLILYVYLFKVIATMTLPKGMVSYLISASVLLYLIVLILCYPLYTKRENRLAEFIARFGGLIALPLVMFMTFGIAYRINEYGISIKRIYVLLLNIWFYGIILLMWLSKSRQIKWITVSFSLVFLLSSIGPWSAVNLTKQSMKSRLQSILNASEAFDNGTFNKERFENFIHNQSDEDFKKTYDTWDYIKAYFSSDNFIDFANTDTINDIINNRYYHLDYTEKDINSTDKEITIYANMSLPFDMRNLEKFDYFIREPSLRLIEENDTRIWEIRELPNHSDIQLSPSEIINELNRKRDENGKMILQTTNEPVLLKYKKNDYAIFITVGSYLYSIESDSIIRLEYDYMNVSIFYNAEK